MNEAAVSLRSVGLSRQRQLTGLVAALAGLPLLTVALRATTDALALERQVLLYLLAVVILAVVGGILIALPAPIAAALLVNFHFVAPLYTLDIADADDAVALVVFVAVAVNVSATVELSARRARSAAQAARTAETLGGLAARNSTKQETLKAVLERARQASNMDTVALETRDRDSGEWPELERAGAASATRRHRRASLCRPDTCGW